MKMKKYKKRILGVVITLFLVFGIFNYGDNNIIFTVKAAGKKCNNMCDSNSFSLNVRLNSDISNQNKKSTYEISTARGIFSLVSVSKENDAVAIEKSGARQGLYVITPDLINAASGWVRSYHFVPNPNVAGATMEENTTDLQPGSPIFIELADVEADNVILAFKLKDNPGINGCDLNCTDKDNNKYTTEVEMNVALTMNNVLVKVAKPKTKTNKRYDDVCRIIREDSSTALSIALDKNDGFKLLNMNEDSIKKLMSKRLDDDEAKKYYEESVPYCFDKNVYKNYSKKTVLKKIKRAIQNHYNRNDILSAATLDPNSAFDRAFIDSKYRAGGVVDKETGANSKAACTSNGSLNSDQQANSCVEIKGDSFSASDIRSLKCDANSSEEYRIGDGNGSTTYNFSNLKSYYTYSKEPVTVQYKKYKTGSDADFNCKASGRDDCNSSVSNWNTATVCTRTCEEAVDVEYGPPVATKAGLCYEYRVRVTSRIKCYSEINPDGGPNEDIPVTTPVPFCMHVAQKGSISFAGPNEKYEKCIKECDNGEYTQKCSKKCYNQVYASGNRKLTVDYETDATKMFAIDTLKKNEFVGVNNTKYNAWNEDNNPHYINDGGHITYIGAYARWYKENKEGRINSTHGKVNGYGYFLTEGVARKIYDVSNDYCSANCDYVGDSNGFYNDEDVEYTIKKNQELYENKLDECSALATCTSKTAEFKMTTNYNNGSTDVTIEYPSSGNSKVTSEKDNMPAQYPTLKGCKTGKDCATDSVIFDYDGCYRTPDNPDSTKYKEGDKFYQTEITYPGTWIKAKTQEISYTTKGDGWYKQNEKFCLPLNAQDVNQNWWIWRMNKTATKGNYYFEDSTGKDNKCTVIDTNAQNTTYDQYSNSAAIDYNIHAIIKSFGHYGWNFNVDCFYALNEKATKVTNSSDNANACKTEPKVRSVDLSNLFPSEGSNNADAAPDATKTGRTPGFNWTSAASISPTKATTNTGTKNYAVDPSKLITAIQTRKETIFDEKNENTYLDYSFHLDQSVLSAIRKYNQGKSYTTFNGRFNTSTTQGDGVNKYGLITYESNLFYHSDGYGGDAIGQKYVKATGNIGCNNDGVGSNCEIFSD